MNIAQRGRGFKAVTLRPTGIEVERGLQRPEQTQAGPAPRFSAAHEGGRSQEMAPKGPRYPTLLPPKGQSRLEASPQPAPTHQPGSPQPCRAAGGAFPTSNPVFEVWRYLRWKKDPRNESTAAERPRGCGVGPGVELGAGSGPSRTKLSLRGAAGGSAGRAGRSSAGDTWKSSVVATGRWEPGRGVQEGRRREGGRTGTASPELPRRGEKPLQSNAANLALPRRPPRAQTGPERGGKGGKKKKKSLTRQI